MSSSNTLKDNQLIWTHTAWNYKTITDLNLQSFHHVQYSVGVWIGKCCCSLLWPSSPSCRPLSPGEGSRWDTCLCPCPSCPWWFCTSLWPPGAQVAGKTLQGHLHRWQVHWLVEWVLTLPPVGENSPHRARPLVRRCTGEWCIRVDFH